MLCNPLWYWLLQESTKFRATFKLMELTDRRIKKINHSLMGKPVPTNEEEDITIEIELEEAEYNRNNPFHSFAEMTRDYIKSKTRRDTLKESVNLLKKLFGVEIQDKDVHFGRWEKLRKLRNNIVHHRGYSKKKVLFSITKDQTHTIDDISVSSEQIVQAMDDMFNFAYAIETGIHKSLHSH